MRNLIIILLAFAWQMGYAQTEDVISYCFYKDAATARLTSNKNKYEFSDLEMIEFKCAEDEAACVQIDVYTSNDSLIIIPLHVIYARANGNIKKRILFSAFAFKYSESKFMINDNKDALYISDAVTTQRISQI